MSRGKPIIERVTSDNPFGCKKKALFSSTSLPADLFHRSRMTRAAFVRSLKKKKKKKKTSFHYY